MHTEGYSLYGRSAQSTAVLEPISPPIQPLTAEDILWKEAEARGLLPSSQEVRRAPTAGNPANLLADQRLRESSQILPQDSREAFFKTLENSTGLFFVKWDSSAVNGADLEAILRRKCESILTVEDGEKIPSSLELLGRPIREYLQAQLAEQEKHKKSTNVWAALLEGTERVGDLQMQLLPFQLGEKELADSIRRHLESDSECSEFKEEVLRSQTSAREFEGRFEQNLRETEEEYQRQIANREAYLGTLELLRPLAESRENLRWWSFRFWRSLFRGGLMTRWRELGKQKAEAESKIEHLLEEKQRLQREAEQRRTAERERFEDSLAAEIRLRAAEQHRRCEEIQTQLAEVRFGLDRAWRELSSVWALPDEIPKTVEEIRIHQAPIADLQQQSKHEAVWAEGWLKRCEELAEKIRLKRILAYHPFVAVTLEDWHSLQAEVGKNSRRFDIVVLKGLRALSSKDRAALALWTDRVVWIEPKRSLTEGRVPARTPGQKSFADFWDEYDRKIWQCDGISLNARLLPLPAGERARLEWEPLADCPNIQIGILPPTKAKPAALAEVRFPRAHPVCQAKRIIFEELQTMTLQIPSPFYRIEVQDETIQLKFLDGAPDAKVEIGKGVEELVAGLETVGISFQKKSGWNVASVRAWMNLNLSNSAIPRNFSL